MRKAVLRAIYHILCRPYWRRLWIIQELVLAKRQSPVLCGDSCILLEDVYNALQVIQGDSAAFGRYIIHYAKGAGVLRKAWDRTKGDKYEISEQLWERPHAIIAAQSEQEAHAESTSHGGIFEAMLLSRESNTGDERDRVYGILGLPCLAGVIEIRAA